MGTVKLDSRLREKLRERIMLAKQDDWPDEIAVRETIRFYYYELDEKEMSVCENIVYMLWDLDGLRPMDELIHRLTHSGTLKRLVFSTEAEVLNTIAVLKEKKIIFDKFTTWTIKYKEKKVSYPKRIIGFAIKPIEDQALSAMSEACTNRRDQAFLDLPEVIGPL